MKTVKRIFTAVVVACLAAGAMSINVFAKETTQIFWFGDYYLKVCAEDAGRTDFTGTAVAGRNTQDRDAATRRYAGAEVYMNNARSYHVTISVQDWRTGGTLYNRSGTDEVYVSFNYSSPISVFACTEATNTSGVYVCKYPTSIAW